MRIVRGDFFVPPCGSNRSIEASSWSDNEASHPRRSVVPDVLATSQQLRRVPRASWCAQIQEEAAIDARVRSQGVSRRRAIVSSNREEATRRDERKRGPHSAAAISRWGIHDAYVYRTRVCVRMRDNRGADT